MILIVWARWSAWTILTCFTKPLHFWHLFWQMPGIFIWTIKYNYYFQFTVIRCNFTKYGDAGEIEKHENLCFVPINIISKKIVVFLWLWLITVIILTALSFIHSVCIVISKTCRSTTTVGDWQFFYLLSKNMDDVMFKQLINEFSQSNLKKIEGE